MHGAQRCAGRATDIKREYKALLIPAIHLIHGRELAHALRTYIRRCADVYAKCMRTIGAQVISTHYVICAVSHFRLPISSYSENFIRTRAPGSRNDCIRFLLVSRLCYCSRSQREHEYDVNERLTLTNPLSPRGTSGPSSQRLT